MTNTNEVTRKSGIGPDNGPYVELNDVAELHACDVSEQQGKAPVKGRRLAPAARKNAGAFSTTRSRRNSKRGQRVKVSVIDVDKQGAVSQATRRHTPASFTGSVITSYGLTRRHGEAS